MRGIFDGFDKTDIERNQTELSQLKRQEYHYIGSQRKHAGHRVYEFNTKTGELREPDIIRCSDIDYMTRKSVANNRIDVHKDCIYIQALNIKNARKRLKRMGYEL